jgi:two-component system CheB/CheR fusion protein
LKEFGHVDSFHQISRVMSRATGVGFSDYNPKAIQRCISRRIAQRHLDGMDVYAAYLREHEEEVESLYQDLFIGPTGFFRDPETFEVLKKRVFPEILKWRVGNEPLRVWLPGCPTGEVAYSVAIAFREFSESKARQIPIQILAIDSNMKAIERARAGIYSQNIVKDVSRERLRRFFAKNDEGYRINKSIRNLRPSEPVGRPAFLANALGHFSQPVNLSRPGVAEEGDPGSLLLAHA